MADLALARVLHVLAVVLWIGGVAMVTLIVLPAARAARDPEQFLRVERRFAAQARWSEPFFLRTRLAVHLERDAHGALQRMYRHHLVVLALSLLTVVGAAAGSHGLL